MHYYQFNIGDYKSHTTHLDPIEDIAYRRLLDWVYLHEKPLPLEIENIARAIGMRTHCECIAIVLSEFFLMTDEGYINERAMREIDAYNAKSQKAKQSATARWSKVKASNANAMRTHSEGNAKHKPLNIKHKPITNIKAYSDKSLTTEQFGFESFYSNYPKKKAKQDALKAWLKLKPDQNLLNLILSKLELQKQSRDWTKDNGKFIPNPSTYINGKRWEDEISSPGKTFDEMSASELADYWG